jgi:hypothetical protein
VCVYIYILTLQTVTEESAGEKEAEESKKKRRIYLNKKTDWQ